MELERKVNELTASESGLPVAKDDVSNPPTDAELDTAFGSAADLYNGFIGLVDDNGAGTTVWLCTVVNDSWFYEQLTLAT